MKKRSRFIKIHKNILLSFVVVFILFISPILFLSIFILNFYLRIYPNISVSDVYVGSMTEKEAVTLLTQKYTLPESISVYVQGVDSQFTLNPKDLISEQDFSESVHAAYKIGRSGNFLSDIKDIGKTFFRQSHITIEIKVNESKLGDFVDTLNSQVPNPPVFPSFELKQGSAVVNAGSKGVLVDATDFQNKLIEAVKNRNQNITIAPKIVDPSLSTEESKTQEKRANDILVYSLSFKTDNYSEILSKQTMISLLSPSGGYFASESEKLTSKITSVVNRESTEAVFQFENERVTQFSPALDGLFVKKEELKNKILLALNKLENDHASQEIEIPVERTHPKTQISDTNNLGIKELLGKGTSKFSGSIPSRIHNVALAASRINGVLVAPNETFSFAKAIGDVSKYTGYKEAYIIQNGRTILGDGGGVCQVSTTLFRAAMKAGLPIIERHAHAYRVGYYEQDSAPGLDATVYVPSVDFKFKNNTSNYILIQTKVDTKKLTAEFSIYGTSDGRVSTISKPVLSNQSAPPDDEYIDDPTLKTGVVQQVEHKAWGGTSTFYYSVTRNGEELFNKKFVSVYQPWKAVFLRGTGQ